MFGEVSMALKIKREREKVCGDGTREDRKRQHH